MKRFALTLAVNALTIIPLLYACEVFLQYKDPRRHLPPDGVVNGTWYTWGHVVEKNSLGFREREIGPKSEDSFRVMVLGDSLTWGAGLSEEERYTRVLEDELRAAHPDQRIEVYNFGLPGASTTQERDVLLKHKDEIRPDLIIVGFCPNDPQPRDENYSTEREAFERRYGRALNSVEYRLGRIGLPRLGRLVRDAAVGMEEKAGWIPDVPASLSRTYAEDSAEWKDFVSALRDIKRASDEMGLPPPIFAALNQSARKGSDYDHPNDYLQTMTKLTRQAEGAASDAGFVTVDFEREIPLEMPNESTTVNELDGHPSARLNQLYAAKLSRLVNDAQPVRVAARTVHLDAFTNTPRRESPSRTKYCPTVGRRGCTSQVSANRLAALIHHPNRDETFRCP